MKLSGWHSPQEISPQFWPILLNPQKVQVVFGASQKKPIPSESPTSWLQILNNKPSQIMDPSPRKNYFSVTRSEK